MHLAMCHLNQYFCNNNNNNNNNITLILTHYYISISPRIAGNFQIPAAEP